MFHTGLKQDPTIHFVSSSWEANAGLPRGQQNADQQLRRTLSLWCAWWPQTIDLVPQRFARPSKEPNCCVSALCHASVLPRPQLLSRDIAC